MYRHDLKMVLKKIKEPFLPISSYLENGQRKNFQLDGPSLWENKILLLLLPPL